MDSLNKLDDLCGLMEDYVAQLRDEISEENAETDNIRAEMSRCADRIDAAVKQIMAELVILDRI